MTNKQIWYKAAHWTITPVEVIKETKARLTIEFQRTKIGWIDSEMRAHDLSKELATEVVNKSGAYENYFQTWGDAHAFLLRKAESEITYLRSALDAAMRKLEKVQGLNAPDAPFVE